MSTRSLWMIGQAVAIGGLTWAFVSTPEPPGAPEKPPIGLIFVLSIVIVAFATGLWVNASDWFKRTYARTGPTGRLALVLVVFGPSVALVALMAASPPTDSQAVVAVPMMILMLLALSCGVAYLATRAFGALDARRARRAGHADEPG